MTSILYLTYLSTRVKSYRYGTLLHISWYLLSLLSRTKIRKKIIVCEFYLLALLTSLIPPPPPPPPPKDPAMIEKFPQVHTVIVFPLYGAKREQAYNNDTTTHFCHVHREFIKCSRVSHVLVMRGSSIDHFRASSWKPLSEVVKVGNAPGLNVQNPHNSN